MKIHAVQDFLHDFTAYVFKINVDAVGSGGGELFLPVRMLVVDGGVKAKVFGNPGAFFIRASDADHAAAVNLADLSGDAARGACRCGNYQRFALLWRSDLHAEKSSESVGAKCPEKNGVRNKRNLRQFLEETFRGFIDDDVVLQSRKACDAVAFFVIGMARLDNFGEANGAHHFA